jgi:mRNA interferase MazF
MPRPAASGGYVPDAGDLVWLTFDPQAGREQAGRRPAIVLSPRTYNQRSSLALLCPITSRVKGYPFEIALPEGCGVRGVVLADQIRSLDWKARRATRAGKVPAQILEEIVARIAPLWGS